MTATEKKKNRKSKKKNNKVKEQKAQAESEVLERVMDSIEMAGASLDFFEGDPKDAKEQESIDAATCEDITELTEAAETGETTVEAQSEDLDSIEAADAVTEETIDELSAAKASDENDEVSDELLASESGEASDEVKASDSIENSDEIQASEGVETLEASQDAENIEMDEHTENGDLLAEEVEEEFVDDTQAQSIIESLLFSSDKPIGMGTFKAVFKDTNYKSKEIKKALNDMMSVYAESSRGVTLEEVNGGWQLRTKVDNMNFLRKLSKARPFKLSGPALEVLAIIAYKQPIIKHEVDEIRGVESGHLIRALMEKHLVCFQGKSELPGKPMQYGTTKKFLEIFSLRNLRELPSLDEIDQLLPDGIGVEEDDERLSDVTAKMSEEYQGNYSEGEEELEKIEDTLGAIDTSSEFFEEEKRRQKEKRDRDRARDIQEALDVGEEVDSKDVRWLERYEAKLAEEAAALEVKEALDAAQESVTNEEGEGVDSVAEIAEETLDELIAKPKEGLGDELSALTQDSLIEPEVLAADNELEMADTKAETESEESSSEDKELETATTFDPFKD